MMTSKRNISPISRAVAIVAGLSFGMATQAGALPQAGSAGPAANAEVGKTYEVTVTELDGDRFSGAYGKASIGSVLLQIPEGKIGEKYSVTVTEIRVNGFLEVPQASCTFKQLGGERDGRAGLCQPAPG